MNINKNKFAYTLFFTNFIQKNNIIISNENKYNLYQLLCMCNELRDDIYNTMLQDISLSCYELQHKHMKQFRDICHTYRIKSRKI